MKRTPLGVGVLLAGLIGLAILARETRLARTVAHWQDERLRADRLALIADYSLREDREVADLDNLMLFSTITHQRHLGDWPFEEDV